jgi:hypothetical protein
MVLSMLPLTNVRPFEANATLDTVLVCPDRVATHA